MYERKNRNREGGIPLLDPEIPKVILKQGSTAITRVTAQGESKEPISHKMKNEVTRTIETRTREGTDGETLSSHTENHDNSKRRLWTPTSIRTTEGSALTQYKAQRDQRTALRTTARCKDIRPYLGSGSHSHPASLQLLRSPPESTLMQLDSEEGSTEIESCAGAYQAEALFRWSEYHQCQFRR